MWELTIDDASRRFEPELVFPLCEGGVQVNCQAQEREYGGDLPHYRRCTGNPKRVSTSAIVCAIECRGVVLTCRFLLTISESGIE